VLNPTAWGGEQTERKNMAWHRKLKVNPESRKKMGKVRMLGRKGHAGRKTWKARKKQRKKQGVQTRVRSCVNKNVVGTLLRPVLHQDTSESPSGGEQENRKLKV